MPQSVPPVPDVATRGRDGLELREGGSQVLDDVPRNREEIEASLLGAEFVVDEVRYAPDRPGHEQVVIVTRLG